MTSSEPLRDLKYWQSKAASIRPETRGFINGQFQESSDGRTFPALNPSTGEPIAAVSRGTRDDVDEAVAAARRSFRSGAWSRMAPRARMDVMYALTRLITQHSEEFALLDSLNMGKPISDMMNADVPFAALTFQYFGETIDKVEGSVTSTDRSALHMIVREPLGVVACIVPWNYPLMMAAWKIAPALAAGNSVVLKPAEQSPLSALLLARLASEAGFPDGVLNVVNGFGDEVGRALALHMDVDKIAFTGSTDVGKLMMVYSGQSNMKRVSAECGGKSPQIIFDDVANFEQMVTYAVTGIYGNQGEVCSAGSRLIVHESLHDRFIARFTERTREMFKPGNPLDPATTMGPLVTPEQKQRVVSYIDKGSKEGACKAFGGTGESGRGNFVEPTLFTGVRPDMSIAREEIFGPVAVVIPFRDAAHAVSIANDSIYGLAAGIWTSDLTTAHRFAADVEAGIVWVNCYDHGDMTQPWGGYKQSGHGRDKCFDTILAHTQTKSVWINLG